MSAIEVTLAKKVVSNPQEAAKLIFKNNPEATKEAFLKVAEMDNISTPDVAMEAATKLIEADQIAIVQKILADIPLNPENLTDTERKALKLISKSIVQIK